MLLGREFDSVDKSISVLAPKILEARIFAIVVELCSGGPNLRMGRFKPCEGSAKTGSPNPMFGCVFNQATDNPHCYPYGTQSSVQCPVFAIRNAFWHMVDSG